MFFKKHFIIITD